MNTARMSIQELIDLKPSMDNPIELVCDDGDYQNDLFRIKVVGVYKKRISVINNHDMLQIIYDSNLKHYPSFDQPKKRNLEVFYEVLYLREISFQSEKKNLLRADSEGLSILKAVENLPPIPNGRKLIYDHDSKELLAWDEELMK